MNLESTFINLPPELKLAIFSFLSPKDLLNYSCVCKEWSHILSDDSLWMPVYETKSSRLDPDLRAEVITNAEKNYLSKATKRTKYRRAPMWKTKCKEIIEEERRLREQLRKRRANYMDKYNEWRSKKRWGNLIEEQTFRSQNCRLVPLIFVIPILLGIGLFIVLLFIHLIEALNISWHQVFAPLYALFAIYSAAALFYLLAAFGSFPSYYYYRQREDMRFDPELICLAVFPPTILVPLLTFVVLLGTKLDALSNGYTHTMGAYAPDMPLPWWMVFSPLYVLTFVQVIWAVVTTKLFWFTYVEEVYPLPLVTRCRRAAVFLAIVLISNAFAVSVYLPIVMKLEGLIDATWPAVLSTLLIFVGLVLLTMLVLSVIIIVYYISKGLQRVRQRRNLFITGIMFFLLQPPAILFLLRAMWRLQGTSDTEDDVHDLTWVFVPLFCVLGVVTITCSMFRFSANCYQK